MLSLSDYDYNLPPELIAQEPISPRDHSRLLVLDKKTGAREHKRFYEIADYLRKGDVLVMNNSKVFPARLIGRRKESGGKLEVFLLRHSGGKKRPCLFDCAQDRPAPSLIKGKGSAEHKADTPFPLAKGEDRKGSCRWQCMVGGRRVKPGLIASFGNKLEAELIKDNGDQTWEVEFDLGYEEMMKMVDKIGEVPLPPYIKRTDAKAQRRKDTESYQTVYADNSKIGSVAAPTAGLHFTPELLSKIKAKGVQIEYITLHVGLGTFAPVKVDDIAKHKMHAERVEIPSEIMAKIYWAKKAGGRIVAVGTTSTRALEAIASEFPISNFRFLYARTGANNIQYPISNFPNEYLKQFNDINEFVNIFIYPGCKFKIVDAMITNFHLPKSTLLMLVSALAGKENIDKAYREAIREKYRFYSYGDAMFIV